ncbi:hypothetical protein [Bifidobacterium avesanii]|uniref:Peptidase C39 n=1 Tax=Bifidobacterium avesanii TaxID=1798157 RepID=A0A7K3TJ83_9BIFI|nr:hypothetical protein [Bifidobacterium avesanii]KAB8288898.1 NADPH:quinone reductase [Bifidobacterium avesanii]NEG79175.1 hypothetical protein [Bifidobacterium avesanii]
MRTPLIYQMTRYDCGPTTLVNALRFLYEREEIDPDLVRAVYARTLDDFDEDGGLGKLGTSHQAMRHVARYFTMYGKATGFPIEAAILRGAEASLAPGSAAFRMLEERGAGEGRRGTAAVIARVWHGDNGHYLLLTGVRDGRVLAFDPFAEEAGDPGGAIDGDVIREVAGMPFAANRSVDPLAFNRDVKADYALKSAANADPADPVGGELIVIRRL